MKKLLYIVSLLVLPLTFSCQRELMSYEGENSIYFDVRSGNSWRDSSMWARQYYTPINFINELGDVVNVPLSIAVAGEVTDYDRAFRVEFVKDSCDAVEGVDFDFKSDWVLPAGESIAWINVSVYRNAYLEDDYRTIVLRVQDNENFTTNLNFDEDLSGRDKINTEDKKYIADPRFHTIELTMSIQKPEDWWGVDFPSYPAEFDVLGAFSSKKYQLMLKVLNFTQEQFCDAIKSKDRARVIDEIFGRYLIEQFDKGEPVLEKDGRLMWVVSIPSKKWKSYQYEW